MALLNVERSARNLLWQARRYDERLAGALVQKYQVSDLVARIIAGRGQVNLDNATDFFTPKLRNLLPDPASLADMEQAAERIAKAIQSGERIAILGDYDVDGVSSAAILFWFWRMVRPDRMPEVYIPDRINEGYGPSKDALRHFYQQEIKLVLLVDCGTVAFEPLACAASWGMEIIVFDHHTPESTLPRALAVVNPHRFDDQSGRFELCAAGVVFLAVVAINRRLRQQGWYLARSNCGTGNTHGLSSADLVPEPDLFFLLDLVALATVCDLVPLTGVNRALVTQGLKVMAQHLVGADRPGLAALAHQAGCFSYPDASYLGFVLGPRLNAAGRMHHAMTSFQLLTTQCSTQARQLAQQLDSFNFERRRLERQAIREATLQAQLDHHPRDRSLLMCKGNWHPGVIGLVASRLAERFGKPVVVLSASYGKASCRSVVGVDLGAAVLAAQRQGLPIQGGGHAMAAGFSTLDERFDELEEFLCSHVAAQIKACGDQVPVLNFDGTLTPHAVSAELLDALAQLAPFGLGNESPRFAIAQAQVIKLHTFGDDGHLQGWVPVGSGRGFKIKAFRAAGGALENCLRCGEPIHLAGSLVRERDTVQFILVDAASASIPTTPAGPQR